MRLGAWTALMSALLLACSSGEPVPFGLDRPPSAPLDEPSTIPSPEVSPWAFETRAADASQLVDGLPFSLSNVDSELRFRVRAVASRDLDQDQDLDALVLLANHEGAVRLVALTHHENRHEVHSLAAYDGKPDCDVRDIEFLAAADRVAYQWRVNCGDESVRRAVVLGVEALALRRIETVAFPLLEGESLEVRFVDHDEDGNEDVAMDLVVAGQAAPVQVSLVFLDRPSGLAREPSEPEAQIASLSQSALRLLARRPAEARANAVRAISIFDALCSESRRARLDVGGGAGVTCGRGPGVGRALSVLARAALRMNEPLAALAAIARFDDPGVRVSPRDSSEARDALAASANLQLHIHHGPALAVEVPPSPTPRLSLLAFRGDSHVLVRGPLPVLVDLERDAASPAELPGETSMSDGRSRVVAIRRRCAGTMIALAGPDPSSRREVLLDPRAPPEGAPCPNLTPTLANDADGWVLLGWAPQGLLAANELRLRMVPLDMQGAPLGEPVVIEPGAAIPAPISAGHATPDARSYALASPEGIVVYTLAPERRARFIRPADWRAPVGMPIDIAVSPSLRRIAWISEGRLEWIELPTD